MCVSDCIVVRDGKLPPAQGRSGTRGARPPDYQTSKWPNAAKRVCEWNSVILDTIAYLTIMEGSDHQMCQVCEERHADKVYFEVFHEAVCPSCKRKSHEFDLLSKKDAVELYGLANDAFRTLSHVVRNNPHNPGWAPMKLYLRKHVKQAAIQQFGGEDQLTQELSKRKQQRSKRSLSSSQEQLDNAIGSLSEELTTGKPLEREIVSNSSRSKPAQSSNKRKKIMDLVSCIRGKEG